MKLPPKGVAWMSIPGQPTEYRPAPPEEITAALAAISGLDESIREKNLFGYLHDPVVTAEWRGHHAFDGLSVTINSPDAWPFSTPASRAIRWRWGVLWQKADWWECGWHPDEKFHGLSKSWAKRIWTTLNPGKGATPP